MAMDYSFVREHVESALERIESAAARSGRPADSVELLAVTKFHPLEAVEAAWAAGLRSFGESRVQEAEVKFPAFLAVHPDARLDMIGHLQSNKAKKAIALFARIQSVDSLDLVLDLDKRAREAGLRRDILLELHTGEESKEGFQSEDELFRALDALLSIEDRRLEPVGLMTMAPNVAEEGPVRSSFRALRAAFEGVSSRFGLPRFTTLSMGMTSDFEIAIEEGSTLVRIGTGLFGRRQAP
jgi:pyridoxal phosphate enzyme, YggS family